MIRPRTSSDAITAVVFFVLAYTAWVGGCSFMPAERLLGWLGAALFIIAALIPGGAEDAGRSLRQRFVKFVADPFFITWFLFVLLLLVQWLNGGREATYAPASGLWTYGPPPVPWLPSSINRWEAAAMLHWFIPAGAVALAIRKRSNRRSRRLLARLMCLNAAVLSLFGIIQLIFGLRIGYGLRGVGDTGHYFATFAYANHAGAFFTLHFGLSAWIFIEELFRDARSLPWLLASGLAAALCLAGASLSLSHASLVLVWTLAGIASVLCIIRGWSRWGPVTRLNVTVSTAAAACLVLLLVLGLGRTHAKEEFSVLGHARIDKNVEGRQFLTDAAVRIWQQAPWFGVGGWGFRYLLPATPTQSGERRMHTGHANVHCDMLQFLAEFGIVGVGLLVTAVAVLAAPLLCSPVWRQPGMTVALAALVAVVIHSCVDLPFRTPAILCAWWGLLALLSSRAEECRERRSTIPSLQPK